jgi:multidrug efflux system membrane fusion protein
MSVGFTEGQDVRAGQVLFTLDAHPVRVAWTDGATTVLEGGLTINDQVVTDGQLRLTPGAKVSITPAVTPKGAPASDR